MATATIPMVRKLKTLPSGPPCRRLTTSRRAASRSKGDARKACRYSYGIEKRLSKIKARMPTHGEPEVAGPSQSECQQDPSGDHASRSHVTLAWIPEMHRAEQNGKKYCRRPESNPSCQCVLRVAPNKYSSERPTATNVTNQSPPHRSTSRPCKETVPNEYPPNTPIKPMSTVTSTSPGDIPARIIFQKHIPEAAHKCPRGAARVVPSPARHRVQP